MSRTRLAMVAAACFAIVRPLEAGAQVTRPRTSVQRTAVTAVSCNSTAPTSRAPAVSPSLTWRGEPAMRWTEWPVALGTRGVRARVIVVDIDPSRVRLDLEIARDGDEVRPWSLDDAPADAAVAFNAGQFTDDGPWGWVVHRGREWQGPGTGPLAGTVVVDSAGHVTISAAAPLRGARPQGLREGVREALQSFPMLLLDGRPAPLLCDPKASLDRTHRDIRFAIGTRADGHVLLALTRYEGVGALSARLPVGPTTHETAELMRRLGAQQALMLDGGLSAQLLVREGTDTHRWEGMRRVPLAIVGKRIP
ncbi:MAG: phosphodiester glycosidase family protein [Gemmatimonadota bacterium]